MKWIGRIAALALLWLTAIGLWIGVGPTEDPDSRADTALVLGAAVIDDDPTPVFAARIDHAIDLYEAGRVHRIVFTGGRSPEDILSEAEAAKAYAIDQGVVPSDILIECQSRTSLSNLRNAKAVMDASGLTSALVVSDPLHLRRAILMGDALGMEVEPSATPSTRYRSWSTKLPFVLREMYFVHHFWVFGQ